MGTGTTRKALRAVGATKLADGIDNFFNRGSSKLSQKASEEDAYDPEKARLEETRRINETLREFTKNLEAPSERLEEKCLNECKVNVQALLKDLKKINEQTFHGKKVNLNLVRMERTLKNIEKDVKGTIKRTLNKRVSQDDADCLKILAMPKGFEKEKSMNAFSNKVFNEALLELSETIEDVIREQMDYIMGQIEDRLEDITNSLEMMSNEFEQIELLKQDDEEQIVEKMSEIYCKIGISEVALSELEHSVKVMVNA